MARYSFIGLLLFALLAYGCSIGVGEKITPVIDPSVGECGINDDGVDIACKTGDCYILPNATKAKCVEGDPCSTAGCPTSCKILESYPMQIACE